MKILFIEVFLDIINWEINYNPGVASIAAVLKKNLFDVEIYPVYKKQDVSFLLKYIKNNNFDVIGFTVTEPTFKSVAKISKKIKKNHPNIFIICGGLYAILNPSIIIDEINCDAACIGEGEMAMLELVKRINKKEKYIYNIKNLLFKKNRKIVKNPLATPLNINKLPDPDRKIFHKWNLDKYTGNIYLKNGLRGGVVVISRGCFYNCSFCGNWHLNAQYKGKFRRVLSPNIATLKLKRIVDEYKYDYFIFIDAQFPTNEGWLKEFTKFYQKRVKIPFTIQLRFGSFNKKTAELLKKAGCYFVQIGLESGDENIRSKILNKKITYQQIQNGVRIFKNQRVDVGINNIIGIPKETPSKFIKTIKINALLNIDYSYLFILYPYKGTQLYKYCYKHKLLRKKNINYFNKIDTKLKLKKFKRKDILYYYQNFQPLVNIYKKSLSNNKLISAIWRKLFNIYATCPTDRKGFWGQLAFWSDKIRVSKFIYNKV